MFVSHCFCWLADQEGKYQSVRARTALCASRSHKLARYEIGMRGDETRKFRFPSRFLFEVKHWRVVLCWYGALAVGDSSLCNRKCYLECHRSAAWPPTEILVFQGEIFSFHDILFYTRKLQQIPTNLCCTFWCESSFTSSKTKCYTVLRLLISNRFLFIDRNQIPLYVCSSEERQSTLFCPCFVFFTGGLLSEKANKEHNIVASTKLWSKVQK